MRSFLPALVLMAAATCGTLHAQFAWQQLTGTRPQARRNHAMCFDSVRGRAVLFGGDSPFALLADTWELVGSTWMPQVFASGPSARSGHSMAYDSHRQRSVLFGGSGPNGALQDTWEWDGQAWTLMSSTSQVPARYGAMAYDPLRQRTVYFGGGQTWEWNGSVWNQALATGPADRVYHGLTFDSTVNKILLFGGFNNPNNGSGNYLGDAWHWDGTGWSQTASVTPGRQGAGLAFDSQRGVAVAFGGYSYLQPNQWVPGSSIYHTSTLELSNGAWQPSSTSGPPARQWHSLVYDSNLRRTILFGGYSDQVPYFDDCWQWIGIPASSSTFGTGCGSPALSLQPAPTSPPAFGTLARAVLSNIPTTYAFMSLGWSRAAFGSFALPLELTTFEMPGCYLLQSADAPAMPLSFTGPSTAVYSLFIPNIPSLFSRELYLQGWAVAPGFNPGNKVTSNGLIWSIGY